MENSTEKLAERFRKECTRARDFLCQILQADVEALGNDEAFIEDGIGIVTGFNRSMKYLFGNKFQEELLVKNDTKTILKQSQSQTNNANDLDVAASKLQNIIEPSIKSPAKTAVLNNNKNANDIPSSPSNSNRRVINIQNDCSVRRSQPKVNREERWINISTEGVIPDQPKVQMNEQTFCFTTYVETPGNFYVCLNALYESHENVLREMDQFYKENLPRIKNVEIHINQVYAYFYEGRWVRAMVRDLVEQNISTVFLIDYGNEEKVEHSKLYPLRSDFKNMFPLAFKCYLANIKPLDTKTGWSKRSRKFMEEKCSNMSGTILPLEQGQNGSLGVSLTINGQPIHFEIIQEKFATLAIKSVANRKVVSTVKNVKEAELVIPKPCQLQKDVPINCILSHYIDPSNFYIRKTDADNDKMLAELNRYYTNKTNSDRDRFSKICFATLYEGSWHRITVTDSLNESDTVVEAYFPDIGLTTKLPTANLKPLCSQFCNLPAMAYRCHLHKIVPKDGKWSNKATKQTKVTIQDKKCTVVVHEGDDSSNGITLKIEGISVNDKIVLKGFGELVKNPEPVPDDVIPEIMEQPMGADDEDVNISMAVQGHTANDEAEVCPHYKGPPHTTCYKGLRCRKKHQLLNNSGWTIKRIPVLMETDQVFPEPNTMIQLVMTTLVNYKSFYGHIQNTVSPNNKSMNVYDELEDLQKLQKALNSSKSIKSFRTYNKLQVLPGIGELVAAYFTADKQWYRAKICNIDESGCEVFYIDYGNKEDVRLDQIAELDKQYSELPPQAMLFVIDNIGSPTDSAQTVKNVVYNILANQILYGLVTSVEAHEIFVVLYDNDQNIGDCLCEMGFVKSKHYEIMKPEDRVVSSEAWRLLRQIEANQGNTLSHHPQLLGIFPG